MGFGGVSEAIADFEFRGFTKFPPEGPTTEAAAADAASLDREYEENLHGRTLDQERRRIADVDSGLAGSAARSLKPPRPRKARVRPVAEILKQSPHTRQKYQIKGLNDKTTIVT